jgi:hypothetical protein
MTAVYPKNQIQTAKDGFLSFINCFFNNICYFCVIKVCFITINGKKAGLNRYQRIGKFGRDLASANSR